MSEDADTVAWLKEYELRSKLSEITNRLLLSQQVALIFLLCEEPKTGLRAINLLMEESNSTKRNNLFFKWLIQQSIFEDLDNWQETFAEYIILIQNFDSVEILGCKEINELIKQFLPNNNFKRLTVPFIRKVLFNLCKQLTCSQWEKLKDSIDEQNNIKKINKLNCKFIEWKLLHWSTNNVIQLNENGKINLDALIAEMKTLGLSNFALDIEALVDKVNSVCIRKNALRLLSSNQSEFYPIIDENNLGFCVIINEKFFLNSSLSTRYGTEKDVERLIEVFTAFGFIVNVYSNLTYMKLIEILDFYARSIKKNHSTFVLIILSHGSENVIYTTDCQAVDINTIEMIFQAEICPNLLGKPKIFIVQSCQGDKWQKQIVKKEKEYANILTDSSMEPSSSSAVLTGPQRGDSMIAWSTVQGFASFRDRHNGSWYIDELCRELWKFGDVFDLVEIFTRVNNNLRSKVYGNQFMVPSLLLSLRAKIKFPISRKNLTQARLLMVKRLIFEKFFIEFLKNYSILFKLNEQMKISNVSGHS